MMTALIIIIFISFIGVGLPDSVLGTAWPEMHLDLGVPISLAGYITAMISVCTVTSSLLSAKVIGKFGTGWVTAVSTLLTAIALVGFSMTQHPAFLFLFAIPLGLGAGSIDTALNNFVAIHYSAAQMNFLHCFYGIGVAISPYIMSLALGADGDWRRGYFIVAILQLGITAVTFLSLPLWKRVEGAPVAVSEETAHNQKLTQLLKRPSVRMCCYAFFGSCALEICSGSWSSSYFVHTRGLTADVAAKVAMLFYIGLALGRFVSGLLSKNFGRRQLLKSFSLILLGGIVIFMIPFPIYISAFSLFLIGLGIGPIFPNLTHLTPDNFGKDISQAIIGAQHAASYLGIMIMPWLFGVLAQCFSTALLPAYLLAMFVLYALPLIGMFKHLKKEKQSA